jgi:predicted nucleic acid-binding Zn ribbon protein
MPSCRSQTHTHRTANRTGHLTPLGELGPTPADISATCYTRAVTKRKDPKLQPMCPNCQRVRVPLGRRFCSAKCRSSYHYWTKYRDDETYRPMPGRLWRNFCEQCGTQFETKRNDAKFCSPRCRTAAHRAAKSPVPPTSAQAVTPPPEPAETRPADFLVGDRWHKTDDGCQRSVGAQRVVLVYSRGSVWSAGLFEVQEYAWRGLTSGRSHNQIESWGSSHGSLREAREFADAEIRSRAKDPKKRVPR